LGLGRLQGAGSCPEHADALKCWLTQDSNASQRRVLAATSVSYVIVLLDTSIVNVALDRISVALAVHVTGLQWVVNACTLAFASLLLTGGTLGDRWGARNVYFGGLTVFTLASAGCGMAVDQPGLIIAHAFQILRHALSAFWSAPPRVNRIELSLSSSAARLDPRTAPG
jgi:MFS family permease